jgi:hypothetical protein
MYYVMLIGPNGLLPINTMDYIMEEPFLSITEGWSYIIENVLPHNRVEKVIFYNPEYPNVAHTYKPELVPTRYNLIAI